MRLNAFDVCLSTNSMVRLDAIANISAMQIAFQKEGDGTKHRWLAQYSMSVRMDLGLQ